MPNPVTKQAALEDLKTLGKKVSLFGQAEMEAYERLLDMIGQSPPLDTVSVGREDIRHILRHFVTKSEDDAVVHDRLQSALRRATCN